MRTHQEFQRCDVWTERGVCGERIAHFRWGFCQKHFDDLKKDDLFTTLQRMKKPERDEVLKMLHRIKSQMPNWTHENPKGEAELAAAVERIRRCRSRGFVCRGPCIERSHLVSAKTVSISVPMMEKAS